MLLPLRIVSIHPDDMRTIFYCWSVNMTTEIVSFVYRFDFILAYSILFDYLIFLILSSSSLTASETPYAKKYEIASAIQHPLYSSEKDINDIAILRLRQPIAFNAGVGPVCLPFK